MTRKPHFYRFASRLGMVNPPWKHEGLNIGVEDGAEAVLTDKFAAKYEGSVVHEYMFPLPGTFPHERFYEVTALHTRKAIETIDTTIREGETQVVAGGDHSVSIASLASLMKRIDPSTIACIRVDSHPDILNAATTTTDNFHGMWFRPLLEQFDVPAIDALTGGRRLRPEQVILIGNLDAEDEELSVLRRLKIKTFSSQDLHEDSEASRQYITAFLSQYQHVHLNVDVDGFDKSIVPATGLPAEHGLLPDDLAFMYDIIRMHPSISIDLLEVNPRKPGGTQTVKFAQELLSSLL